MSDHRQRLTADILLTLGQRLGDDHLAKLFPELQPEAVRRYLKQAAAELAAEPGGERRQFRERRRTPDRRRAGRKLSLYTDGASRGNPGPAGAGFLIVDEEERELAAHKRYLGECTNNVAEYQALILGLEEVLRLGSDEISIYLDSELIVRQLLGTYKVNDDKLKPLFAEAKSLLDRLPFYQIAHVPREENRRADQLANEAIDQQQSD